MTTSAIRQCRGSGERHRFQNKAALLLTAVTLVLLIALSVIFGEFDTPSIVPSFDASARLLEDGNDDDAVKDYTGFSCRYIHEQVPDAGDDQCRFARTCNDGEGVWAPFVFCYSNKFSALTLFLAISPLMIVWMVTLFRLLGSTAEDFFSPGLEMFSVKSGLPPRFAGVTLLALGNGAADVSATISAIVSDVDNGYKFSLGALTGAAMLVGGVVAGIVVLVADGVPCRGALVRDATALFITVCVVWANLSTGMIGPGTTSLFLSLYGLFVCIVLVADVYHRAVVLPRIQAIQRLQVTDGTLDEATLPADTTNDGPSAAFSRVITAISNYDNICAGDTTTTDSTTGETGEWGISSGGVPTAQQQGAALQESDGPIILHGQNGLLTDPHNHHVNSEAAGMSNPTADADGSGSYSLLQDQMDHFCGADGSMGFRAVNWRGALEDCKAEVLTNISEAWDDIAYNGDLNMAEKFMLICEFPFTLLRKLTVPIPCEGYYNRGLIALSMVICPIWFAYYIWSGHDINLLSRHSILYFIIIWVLAAACGIAVMRLAPGGEGTMSMIIATPIAFIGFVIAATWIDFFADHLVSLLDFIGIILRIPGAIMGLTVLAWGNSMGDLSANITMARKGLANMAMTACFAGPVFNILVGLGLGFSGLASKTGKSEASVTLSAPIVTGFIFVILNCIMIVVTGIFLCHGRIQTHYGYFALGLYATYLIVSITLEFAM